MTLRNLLLSLAGAALLLLPSEGAQINVGVAKADITPDYPVRLSGFGFRRAESEGVNQRIWVKALAFGDSEKGPAILITTDNLGVSSAIRAEIAHRLQRKTRVRPERLAITATHTHTAPMLTGVAPTLFGEPIPPEHQANIDRYTREFIDALEKVALEAVENLRPATLEWGLGAAGFAINRRTQGGPVDHDLPVLVVKDPSGNIRAVHFNYACHCVTLSHNQIGGDWAGYAALAIEGKYPGAIALPAIGCGADQNPSSGVTGDKTEIAAEQGREIAKAIEGVVNRELVSITSPLEAETQTIELAFAEARTREEWQKRAALTNAPPGHQRAIGYQAFKTLERLDRGEQLSTSLPYLVQTWTFGDELAMVFLPGEVVVDYSLRLKQELDRSRLWVNAYANDAPCYIPSERILKEGGYEGGEAMVYYNQPQKLAPGLEDKIINAIHEQLPESYRPPAGTEGTVPRSPAESLKLIRTPPGLNVELIASEPLIQSPVALDWDAQGRLWVCEMYDYPSGVDGNWLPGGRIKLLTDLDGNGQYDESKVFLEGIPFPTGVTAYGRGLFVCAAPDLLYAEDTDGDGQADRVEKVFSGFATANYQARLNSLSLGLDNWMYAANGLITGTVETPAGAVDIRGRDFRFDLVSRVLEPVAGLSQQGRVRDDWGNWYGVDNTRALLHFPYEEAYFRRNPHIRAPESTVVPRSDFDLRQLFPASRTLERYNDPDNFNRVTSACGLAVYRDTLLGEHLAGDVFTCEPVHNLVLRRELTTSGTELRQSRPAGEQDSEFLASKDQWFRPVQVRTGPDGALYVVDMYRFVLEHPRWIPAARLAALDLRAGADRGRIYRLRPRDVALRPVIDLSQLSGAELAARLDSPNGTERDRVHLELLWRMDQFAVGTLKNLARRSTYPEARLQALSLLQGLGALDQPLLREALADEDDRVRRHAVKLTEPILRGQPDSPLLAVLVSMIDNASPTLAQQLAFTLGESRSPVAGQALARLANAWVEDSGVRLAVLSSAPRFVGELLQLTQSARFRERWEDWLLPLNQTAVALGRQDLVLNSLKAVLSPSARPLDLKAANGFLQILTRSGTSLQTLVQRRTDASEFMQLLAGAGAAARKKAQDDSASESERGQSLQLLSVLPGSQQALIPLLADIVTAPASSGLKRSALAVLQQQQGPEPASLLLERWTQSGPAARRDIASLLLTRDLWARQLLQQVESGQVRASEISMVDRDRLLQSSNSELRSIAEMVFPRPQSRDAVIERYLSALPPEGNSEAGRELFVRVCASCHQVGEQGFPVGPDLATLASRDQEYWLKNILDPNAAIEPRFVAYEVELKDGRTLSGVISGESATSITVLASGGTSETVLRQEVDRITASALSLMPAGLEEGISPKDLADLISFLRSGSSPKEFPGNTPALVEQNAGGALMLWAKTAEIYGDQIAFEPHFQNIGMWQAAGDYIVWRLGVKQEGDYDLHFDYACAADSAGNTYELRLGKNSLSGPVQATGSDWSNYRRVKVGKVHLEPGLHELVIRPASSPRHALIDLRAVAIVPAGSNPPWPLAEGRDQPLRNARDVARFLLDASRPQKVRETAAEANPQFATDLIVELTRDWPDSPEAQYERIPWIWRVSLLAGRRNDHLELRRMLQVTLPRPDEPLEEWQAVVLGGGIINGLSQRGLQPRQRLQEILSDNETEQERLDRSVRLAAQMADDSKVPSGTRYDALRMLALADWERTGPQITRYLASANAELQMGAISAAGDLQQKEANRELLEHFHRFTPSNRSIAFQALARTEAGLEQFIEAAKEGRLSVRGLEGELEKLAGTSTRHQRELRSILRSNSLQVLE